MGKSFKDVSSGSHSEHYKYDKCRGFQKKKMRSIQHGVRNENRNSDESSFINTKKKTNEYWASKYIGIAPNVNGYNNWRSVEREVYNNDFQKGNPEKSTRWSGENLVDDIKKIINDIEKTVKCERGNHNIKNYLEATLKQIERRGEAKIFKGHRKTTEIFKKSYNKIIIK